MTTGRTTTGPMPTGPVMTAREVTKTYGGTHALRGVSLGVAPGRVTALFGENGAGKSTLMKILAGIESPTTGQVELDGDVVEFESPRQAADNGVVIIHQELSLCPNLSIQDNLFLAREERGRFGSVDRGAQRAATATVLERLEEKLDPDAQVGDLRIGQQQLVEIARALLQNARVLIMDEPTSALSMTEVDVLFRVIRELTSHGVAVIYISHHLEESLEIADDVAVLRDGQLVATGTAAEVDLGWVVQHMVGRDQGSLFPKRNARLGDVALSVHHLQVADPSNPQRLAVDGIDLEIRAGEIVGVYGLMASGRTELLEAIAGRLPVTSGGITFAGDELSGSVRDRIARGIALVPEDRQRDGLVQTMSVGQNLSLSSLTSFVRRGLITRGRERSAVAEMITDVTVKTSGQAAPIGSLSGGNQQKVVIGKALLTHPKVLLLDEPSRGVDIGAKADIFALMTEQAESGLAVVFTTSEAEEALHIPDRLLILERGRLVADLDPHSIDRGRLMQLADGSSRSRTGETP
jgi:erythritol transport system ATP-binding protein